MTGILLAWKAEAWPPCWDERLQFTHPHAIKEHQRNKVIQVFSLLEISHEDYFGKQFVYSCYSSLSSSMMMATYVRSSVL